MIPSEIAEQIKKTVQDVRFTDFKTIQTQYYEVCYICKFHHNTITNLDMMMMNKAGFELISASADNTSDELILILVIRPLASPQEMIN